MLIKTDNYHNKFPDPFQTFQQIEESVKEEEKVRLNKKRKMLGTIAIFIALMQ